MATDGCDGAGEFHPDPLVRRDQRLRAAELLPIVRAAMARGEGPPAVLAWVRFQGELSVHSGNWTEADEVRARALAGRLAESLNGLRQAEFGTGQPAATLGLSHPLERSDR